MGLSFVTSRIIPTNNGINQWAVFATQAGRRETTEARATRPTRTAFTAKRLVLKVRTNDSTGGNTVITLLKNGGATAITLTVNPLATGVFDISADVAYALNDTVSIKVDATTRTGGANNFEGEWAFVCDYGAETVTPVMAVGGFTNAASASKFAGLCQFADWNATEVGNRLYMPVAGLIRNMQVYAITNARTTPNDISARINGVTSSNLTVQYTTGVTLLLEDLTGSEAIANGDLVGSIHVTGTGTQNFENNYVVYEFVATAAGEFPVVHDDNVSGQEYAPGPGVTEFWSLFGSYIEAKTPANEAAAQMPMVLPVQLDRASVYVSANNVGASTMKPRRNGASPGMSVPISASGTGWFHDLVTAPVRYKATDDAALEFATGAGGSAMNVKRSIFRAALIPAPSVGTIAADATVSHDTQVGINVSALDTTYGVTHSLRRHTSDLGASAASWLATATEVATPSATGLQTITGQTPDTEFHWALVSTSAGGDSVVSARVERWTAPARPTGHVNLFTGSSNIQDQATDATSGVYGHNWYIAETGNPPNIEGFTAAGTSPLQFIYNEIDGIGLVGGQSYDRWITSFAQAGVPAACPHLRESAFVGPLTDTTAGPDAPAVIAVGPGGTTQTSIDVQLTSFDAGADEHDLYIGTTPIGGNAEVLGTQIANDIDVSGGAPVTSADDANLLAIGLVPGQTYFFVVVTRSLGTGPVESNELVLVTVAGANIVLNKATMSFAALAGGPNPAQQTILLDNTGDVDLVWSNSGVPPWLTLTPPSGVLAPAAQESIDADVDVTGLAPGLYVATVAWEDPAAPNTPQTIEFNLLVSPVSQASGWVTTLAVSNVSATLITITPIGLEAP